MSMPGKTGAIPRATRAIWRRSDISASPAPGYCTFTATSRSSSDSDPPARSRQRPRWTCPIDAAAVGRPVEPDEPLGPVVAEVRGQLLAHGRGRHRGSGVLQRGEVLAVGSADLLGQGGLQDAEGLAELHRTALELAQGAEQLLGGALLHLGEHRLGGLAAEPLAEPHRLPAGVAERERSESGRARGSLAGELGHAPIVRVDAIGLPHPFRRGVPAARDRAEVRA